MSWNYDILRIKDKIGIGTTKPEYKLDVPSGWFRFGPGGDSGRIYAVYGKSPDPLAPILKLSDFDDAPRIQFQNIGKGDEDKPEFSSWIGMAKSKSKNIALMGEKVGIGTTNPQFELDVPSGWFRFGPGGDSGRIFTKYGPSPSAPILTISDFDDPPRIRFQQTGTGDEDNPQYSAWIGMAGGRTNHLSIASGSVRFCDNAENEKIRMDMQTGDIKLYGADCAEEFEVVESVSIDPGTTLVINDEGKLTPCNRPYDNKVIGVVSGARDLKPGIILGKRPKSNRRLPIALTGKVFCKVDAQDNPIQVGDLLTTSSTLGHAMKATDASKSFGTVIGKALDKLDDGASLIPILVALH